MANNNYDTLKFGSAFKNAKADGREIFSWNNKQYHTYTKEELLNDKETTQRLADTYKWNSKMRNEFGLGDATVTLKNDPPKSPKQEMKGETSSLQKPTNSFNKDYSSPMGGQDIMRPGEYPRPMNTYGQPEMVNTYDQPEAMNTYGNEQSMEGYKWDGVQPLPPTMQNKPGQREYSKKLADELVLAMALQLGTMGMGAGINAVTKGSKGMLNAYEVANTSRKGLAPGMKALGYETESANLIPAGENVLQNILRAQNEFRNKQVLDYINQAINKGQGLR